ncbi:MAG: tyrosine-protein phosphatase [Sphingobacterium sp.]|uniref:tyrosine-protein phosphatase n=1 Tax=Sphingobacterium sp. JB170 TaxID=1434842 RepID=UPI00097F0271|nr:CpsB/CapC family capsule biosynthesis tyrosine phosphatase [Sphingobacterium sp. JB170]SJN42838.1 capsular polysaccharide biosythesis protein, putative [Sphingobacterium sp. JB170]
MSFWSKLFKREKQDTSTGGKLTWVGYDMHNHILPGIDDGSKSIEDSLKLVRGLQELGINKCVATPHVMHGVHNNTPKTIREAYLKLKAALEAQNIKFDLHYSAEYMVDDHLDILVQNDDLCPLPNRHMLIEMSYLAESKALFQIIKDVQEKGYQPILAHPERYNYYHQNFKVYKEIKDAGCMLQLNLLSISRYYGEHVKSAALTLVKSGMYDLVGTDMHHEKHLNALKQVTAKYDILGLLKDNPIKNATIFDDSQKLAI